MSDADRAAAREMIAESVGKNGQVDFKSLKALQYRWANDAKEHELANTQFEGEIAREVRNGYVQRIDRATKEVLGLIPESQWHYSDTLLNDAARRTVEAFKADHPREYACEVPSHDFDPSKTLTSQGITCHKAAPAKSR